MAISDSFDAIRFYTLLDPYYYTVDNRPLTDLENNQDLLANAGDATINALHASVIATGFAMRGYAREDYAVGTITFNGDLTFTINRAILNQSLAVSGSDAREVPQVGIQVDAETLGPFVITAGVGEETPYLVQARRVDASATTPYYDAANAFSSDTHLVGGIEYSIKTGADVPTGSGFASIPSADAGWIPLIGVVLGNGEGSIEAGDVNYGDNDARFFEEGAVFGAGGGAEFELNVDSRIATADQQTFNGLTIDANYALTFVDGAFQSGTTINSSTSIDMPEPLPEGTVVDFVTTAGGYYVGGRVKRDVRVTTASQQVFNSLTINARYASVYINGTYQDNFTVISATSISLSEAVPAGTRVVFEEKTAGVADLSIVVPEGGDTGQALIKNSDTDHDYDWGDVSGGSGVPNGGGTGQVLTKLSPTDGDADWQDPATGGGGETFSVETQTASAGQSVFVIGTDPNTVLVFQDGEHITETIVVVDPNQVVLPSPLSGGESMVFVQVGDSSPDSVTIGKEQDLNHILNSKESFIPPSSPISDVIAINTTGSFIASSLSSGEVYRSNNGGATWSIASAAGLPSEIGGLATDGSRYVAVGIGGQTSYSDDSGNSWTPNSIVAGVTFFESVTYDSDNGVFLAVSDGGVIADSADGITWNTQLIDGGTVDFLDVHFDNGLTVAVGNNGTTSNIWTSADGSTWTDADTGGVSGPFNSVWYGGATWFAAADADIATSLTGATWGSAQALTVAGKGAYYIDGVYFIFCEDNVVYASTDQGVSWIRYIIPGHVSTDYFSCAATSGTSTTFLGSFEMTRHFAKIARGL